MRSKQLSKDGTDGTSRADCHATGISKIACVGYGWGADPLWPLAQSGAVDAWAVVHGHINRGFIRQVKTPGIVLVSDAVAH